MDFDEIEKLSENEINMLYDDVIKISYCEDAFLFSQTDCPYGYHKSSIKCYYDFISKTTNCPSGTPTAEVTYKARCFHDSEHGSSEFSSFSVYTVKFKCIR